MSNKPRLLFFAVFLVCAGLLGFGLVLQHVKHLEPCAMCILQRYAFVLVGLCGLAAALHDPRPKIARIYAASILLFSVLGAGVAARQAWMQRFPSAEAECGPGLDYTLQAFPLADALPMIFKGGGDCSKVQWTFLGGSIPEWSLVWFGVCALAALWIWREAGSQPR